MAEAHMTRVLVTESGRPVTYTAYGTEMGMELVDRLTDDVTKSIKTIDVIDALHLRPDSLDYCRTVSSAYQRIRHLRETAW